MKKWQEEHLAFLKLYADVKSYQVKNLYIAFCLFYPNFITTYNGFKNKRHEMGISSRKCKFPNVRRKPLMSEQVKKGFVRIKVAEGKWVQKQKYIYESHYGINLPPRWNVIFLDGNNRNFDINNLYPLPLELVGLFIGHTSGVIKGNPQATLLNIQIARTIRATFNFARKFDFVGKQGHLKWEVAEKVRQRQIKRLASMTEEEKEEERRKRKERSRIRYEKLKTENPELYEKQKEKMKIYKREWLRRKRSEK